MDPGRINNYNNFLKTLDRNIITAPKIDNINKKETLSHEINKNIKNEDDIKKEFNDIKKELDDIIDTINNSFHIDNTSSYNDKDPLKDILTNDPNQYIDFLNKGLNVKLYKTFTPIKSQIPDKKEEPPIEITEKIYIDVEINTITDLLNLIYTYKVEPSIQYNINMKALHDIKEPLEELNNMIGMKELKSNIVDQILYFIQDLHINKDATGEFLHTVIYGPPGTGKTEIAKIMGKIYSKIGILSKGTFKKVTRSDLVAGYLGQTALKTREVIKEALGGVLFIDEAYSLGNPEKKDSFSKECIDTLCESLSDHKSNLMVIIAGYEKELKECFFSFNQGLDSRFTWRFKTDTYTHEDLYKIFLKKTNDIGWEIDTQSNITAEWFKTNKDCFKFFGRDIETLLSKTKIAHSRRVFCKSDSEKKKITIKDLDKGFEVYLKNDDIKNKREEEEMKRYLYNTLYC
jgi:SpoVK/Ycf46/Vps4 family AAA+-type ATPase